MSASQSSSRGRRTRASQSSSRRSKSATTKNTGPYDGAFAQHLVDHNILPDDYEYPDGGLSPEPDNIDEVRQALSRRRASLSPSRFSNDDFRRFRRADSHAASERQVTSNLIPVIQRDVGDTKSVASEIPFTNLQPLIDGTLVSGNPDLYYDARPEQLHQKVRRELNGYIVPSTQTNRPIIPNFCLAVKGTKGTMDVALRQDCYDGALGARAMHKLQSYGMSESEPRYDNKAYTLTSVYQAGVLRIYTSHPIQTPKGQPGFAMNLVKVVALIDSLDAFREGVAAFRNGRDWAKEQRDDAIKKENEASLLIESSVGGTCSNDTSADELSLDIRPPVKRSRTQSRPNIR